MKAKYIILSLLGAAALLFGCAKEPITGRDNSVLSVDNSYVRIDTLGGTSTIKITAKESWKLLVKASYEYEYTPEGDTTGKKKKATVDTLITPGTHSKPRGIDNPVESWIAVDNIPIKLVEFDGKTDSLIVGGAGTADIVFSAPAGMSYRTQDVRIISESGAQIILRVAQGEDVIKTYTVPEVIKLIKSGKAGGSPVLVKGIICKIDEISTSYGNATYYLSEDGTMSGSYTEAGDGDDGNWFEVYRGYWIGGEKFTKGDEIAVGDEVTVKGTLTLYKGIPETNQNDSEITEITKSLVAVSPSSIDVPAEGGVVEVSALYSGDKLNFAIDDAGLKFLSIVGTYESGDTTFVKIRVDENKGSAGRTGTVVFTSSKGKNSSRATAEIKQGVAALKNIAELSAMFSSTSDEPFVANFAAPAVVSYVNGSNVFFLDSTGGILYYKNAEDTNTYTAGTTISGEFSGKGKLYSALPELTLITGGTRGTADVPAIQTVTLAELVANYTRYLSIPVKLVGITLNGSADGSAKVNIDINQGETHIDLRTQNKTIKLTQGTVGDAIVIPTLYNTTKQVGLWEQDHFTPTSN